VSHGGRRQSSRLPFWLAAGICLSVGLLSWFGFTASREFQRSSRLLVQRRADETGRLLVTALTRDMRAAQTSILSSSAWDELSVDSAHEMSAVVASAFARYPYPEAFIAWEPRRSDAEFVFYVRSDRPPSWAPQQDGPNRYPVRILSAPAVAPILARIIEADGAAGRPFSISEVDIAGAAYQVVAQFRYSDRLRQHVVSARGFIVNLAWVRQHYFGELTRQVAEINGDDPGLTLSIVDQDGATVVGGRDGLDGSMVSRRTFPVAFFDPVLIAVNRPTTVRAPEWTVLVSGAADPTLGAALRGAELTLAIASLAAVILALGLGMTARAMRTATELAEMRAEFMSSVTHELKTPIASIRAMADTMSRGRYRTADVLQEYAFVVGQEAKRLARLVDNVLAHSRITDVADVYSFDSVDVEEAITSAFDGFGHQLREEQFSMAFDFPPELPAIRADRAALGLLLDNLIDNALRHSGEIKDLRVTVSATANHVSIRFADRGLGIAPEDLGRVTQKFVRGRNAGPGGSGLGLAIVARIVSDHGGEMKIDSALTIGTVVTLTFPVANRANAFRPQLLRRRTRA
jgi:signal transduction histidine kinase